MPTKRDHMKSVKAFRTALLRPVHTWIGISAGAVLSVIALSGSVITFRADLERAAMPRSTVAATARRIDIDRAAQEVARFRPNSRIRRVRLPAETSDPYVFQVESAGKRTERIVSDAATGRILGTLQPGWVEWVVDLHRNLLSGATGRKAVGIAGIVLFALSTTGLLMWLAGSRNWRSWISVSLQGSKRRFRFDLHRASGLWAYGFLTVMSFAGIGLAFPQTYRDAVQSLTGKPATVAGPKGIKSKARQTLGTYVRAGQLAMPDGVPMELRLADGKGAVDLRLHRAGDLATAGNHVYLDPATAAVLQVDRIVDRPLGARLYAALTPIHYSEFGGAPVKIVWGLMGLAPLLLFVTGLLTWWRPAKPNSRQFVAPKDRAEDAVLSGQSL